MELPFSVSPAPSASTSVPTARSNTQPMDLDPPMTCIQIPDLDAYVLVTYFGPSLEL